MATKKRLTYKQAVRKIADNWSSLPIGNRWENLPIRCSLKDTNGGYGPEALWISTTDHADAYEVNEEWIGVLPDGRIIWAYASGCSCWDGDFTIEHVHEKDIKTLQMNHPENMNVDWKKKIIDFAMSLDKKK